MKNKKAYSLLAICLMLSGLLLSCKKDNTDEGDGQGNGSIVPVQSLSASVSGSTFNAATIVHQLIGDTMHVIIATNLAGDIMTMRLENLTPGTYPIDFDVPTITYFTGGYIYDQSNAANGEIVITANTGTHISGTFHTNVGNIAETGQTFEITNGVFTEISID